MGIAAKGFDIFNTWEKYMADISGKLKDKYGLRELPSQALIQRWLDETNSQIRRGYSNEFAGDQAARLVFRDYKAGVTKSDADTIAELLEQAGKK